MVELSRPYLADLFLTGGEYDRGTTAGAETGTGVIRALGLRRLGI
jgi:hypothetical protein